MSEFDALRALSARIGADPLLVQGAGGNTSIKQGEVLWIKASGTWLKNALDDEIMVPVRMPPLLEAVAHDHPDAEKAHAFTIAELNPNGLRPSIETTVHALMPQPVVVHVHCVNTIAMAVRTDAQLMLSERLRGLNWALVPYARPGLPLARAIASVIRPRTDVLVLGNHGLAVAAASVAEAEELLMQVSGLLAAGARSAPAPDRDALLRLAAGSQYRLPETDRTHAVATDLASCRMAAGGSLYPDHVVFLGEGSVIARPEDDATAVADAEMQAGRPSPKQILFPGKGILMRRDADAGAEALALCLADVTCRISEGAAVRYLTAQENHELLNWDAEKYRQELARGAATLQ